ncbi:class I adenylate-forming enzyme family protein [Rhodococcus qingshengii]|uniref:class I adenylate-forming enzyme family protein n=1 Tax=Rhodococcus qingshengii TaxID=334542 RepID=UPI00237CB6F1|nr:class I adenylate-forming enzyme family protein [Rhodococcus qingshengii]WCT05864.1 class I adenylate-forming enzyme family protein [Rhodococcus qingshengii]
MSESTTSGFLTNLAHQADPASIALLQGDRAFTYGQLVHAATQWRDVLDPLIDEGEVVAVDFMESAFEYAAVLLAVMAAGGIHLSSRRPEATWRRLSDIGGCWHAITRKSISPDTGPSLRSVLDLDHSVLIHPPDKQPNRPPSQRLRGRILETSGSSGEAKWVYWTEADLLSDRRTWTEEVGLGDQDVVLNIHPLDFAHGVDVHLLAALCAGASMVHVPGRFDPSLTLERLTHHHATYMSALPAHYEAISSSPAASSALGAHLTKAFTGGALLSAGAAQELFDRCGVMLKRLYGATEAGIMCADLSTDLQTRPALTPMEGVDMEIRPLPGINFTRHQIGEPYFRRTHLATAYWADTERTTTAFAGGWYASGDAVRVAADGTVAVLGRSDDVWIDDDTVRSASEYVDTISSVDGIDEVVVFAPSANPHNVITVFCRLTSQEVVSAGPRENVDALVSELGGSTHLYYMSDWPKTAVGKPNRQALMAWARATEW